MSNIEMAGATASNAAGSDDHVAIAAADTASALVTVVAGAGDLAAAGDAAVAAADPVADASVAASAATDLVAAYVTGGSVAPDAGVFADAVATNAAGGDVAAAAVAADAAAPGWPKYMVLKSKRNNKYLRYVGEGAPLKFDGEDATSPYCKFELEMSKTVKGMFNIRCCYNNKYWVQLDWIVNMVTAGATEPNEDLSRSWCTLFQPHYYDSASGDKTTIGILFGGTSWTGLNHSSDPDFNLCMHLDSGTADEYTIIDWEWLLVLPKHFALKGSNGMYLGKATNESFIWLMYSDIGNESVATEFVRIGDGTIFIKSSGTNKFWMVGEKDITTITALWTDTSYNVGRVMEFEATKTGSNTIALRSLRFNKFCARGREPRDVFLFPSTSTTTDDAILTVDEVVFSRQIYNVRFHLANARIYNESIETMVNTTASNKTTEEDKVTVGIKYTKSSSSSWDQSVALRLGVSTTLQTGIPFMVNGSVTVSAEFEGSYNWGEAIQESVEIESTNEVIVPPMTIVTLSLLATKGTCDVPFSYCQRDILTNGKAVIRQKEDGVYTGINSYNFHYVATEEKIPSAAESLSAHSSVV